MFDILNAFSAVISSLTTLDLFVWFVSSVLIFGVVMIAIKIIRGKEI